MRQRGENITQNDQDGGGQKSAGYSLSHNAPGGFVSPSRSCHMIVVMRSSAHSLERHHQRCVIVTCRLLTTASPSSRSVSQTDGVVA